MKKLLIGFAAAAVVIAAPAQAHKGHGHHGKGGHQAAAAPQTVKLDGVDVPVCSATVKDKCVNPREAGLKFGNRASAEYNKK